MGVYTMRTKYDVYFMEYANILGLREEKGNISEDKYFSLYDKLIEWKARADSLE